MSREFDIDPYKLSQFIVDFNAAYTFLDEQERTLLQEYDNAVDEMYPEGIPLDQEDDILRAMESEFPGIGQIINKVLDYQTEIAKSRQGGKVN